MAYTTRLVSTNATGTLVGNGQSGIDGTVVNASSGSVSIKNDTGGISQSANGRFIIFLSTSSNFDTQEALGDLDQDIFLKDMQTNALTRITINTSNVSNPDISDDGQTIVYQSGNSLFKLNIVSPTPVLISAQADDIHMSANGSYVVYTHTVDKQIYRVNLDADGPPVSVLVSVDTDGTTIGNDESANAFVDNSGNVVFESEASNFAAGNANATFEVFRKDIDGTLTRVSETIDGGGGVRFGSLALGSGEAVISGNGRYVVFTSWNNDLAPITNANGSSSLNGGAAVNSVVYRKDLVTGEIEVVSQGPTGRTTAGAENPSVSDDGRFVLFKTANGIANDGTLNPGLTPTSPNYYSNWFVKDMATGKVYNIDLPRSSLKLPVGPATFQAPYISQNAVISGDGKYITLSSIQSLNTGTIPQNSLFTGTSLNNNDGKFDVFRLDISSLSSAPIGLDIVGDPNNTQTDDLLTGASLGDKIQGLLGNEAVEKVQTFAHSAVKQSEYQGRT